MNHWNSGNVSPYTAVPPLVPFVQGEFLHCATKGAPACCLLYLCSCTCLIVLWQIAHADAADLTDNGEMIAYPQCPAIEDLELTHASPATDQSMQDTIPPNITNMIRQSLPHGPCRVCEMSQTSLPRPHRWQISLSTRLDRLRH